MNYKLKAGEQLQERVRKILRGQMREASDLLANAPESDAPIHGARKWLKQARAVLRLTKPALGEKAWRREDRRIRRIARTLAERRDAQVLRITVKKLKDQQTNPAVHSALAKLGRNISAGAAEAAGAPRKLRKQEAKGRARLKSTRRRVKELPLGQLDWPELSRGILETYRAGAEALASAGRDRSPEELHEWRKRVKDLWYQLRVLQPIQKREMSALAEDAKQLSLRLGDDHDLFMVETAAKAAKLKPRELQLVLSFIEQGREELQDAAFKLGRQVYAEEPEIFRKRIEKRAEEWAGK